VFVESSIAHLIPYEHDNDVLLGVVAQLLEPALHVLKSDLLRDVVHQQRADGTSAMSNGRKWKYVISERN
jgi:hypothetical protein